MTAHAALLVFILWGANGSPEEGEVRARTCAAAIAYVREGLQPGQTMHVVSCEVGS